MTRRPFDALYLTDGEIAHKLGFSCADWQSIAKTLEKQGLPVVDPVFHSRRYWPAIKAFLDRRNGLLQGASPLVPDGEENWDGNRGRTSRARA